jgi:hypothetical protein
MKQFRLQRVVVSTNNLAGKSRNAAWDGLASVAQFWGSVFFTTNSPGLSWLLVFHHLQCQSHDI